MALTVEQIHAAADAIADKGDKPTLASVRTALGGGSFTTISEALKTWREAQTEEHALAEVQVPDAITERTQALQAAIWQAAVAEAERRLQAERDALADAREAARAEVAEAKEAVTTLEAEAQEAQTEIERLQANLASTEAKAEQAEAKQREAEQAKTAAEATAAAKLEGLEARLADAQATIQALIAKIEKPKAPPSRGK